MVIYIFDYVIYWIIPDFFNGRRVIFYSSFSVIFMVFSCFIYAEILYFYTQKWDRFYSIPLLILCYFYGTYIYGTGHLSNKS